MLNRVLYLSCINVHTLLSCTSTYTDRIRQKSNSNRLKNDVLQSLSLNISYCMTTRSLNGSVALWHMYSKQLCQDVRVGMARYQDEFHHNMLCGHYNHLDLLGLFKSLGTHQIQSLQPSSLHPSFKAGWSNLSSIVQATRTCWFKFWPEEELPRFIHQAQWYQTSASNISYLANVVIYQQSNKFRASVVASKKHSPCALFTFF